LSECNNYCNIWKCTRNYSYLIRDFKLTELEKKIGGIEILIRRWVITRARYIKSKPVQKSDHGLKQNFNPYLVDKIRTMIGYIKSGSIQNSIQDLVYKIQIRTYYINYIYPFRSDIWVRNLSMDNVKIYPSW
jgi:hypothetical protein